MPHGPWIDMEELKPERNEYVEVVYPNGSYLLPYDTARETFLFPVGFPLGGPENLPGNPEGDPIKWRYLEDSHSQMWLYYEVQQLTKANEDLGALIADLNAEVARLIPTAAEALQKAKRLREYAKETAKDMDKACEILKPWERLILGEHDPQRELLLASQAAVNALYEHRERLT